MRLADGVLLVVDVLEGVGAATERAIQQAVAEGLAITLIISKVSRCWEREGGQQHCGQFEGSLRCVCDEPSVQLNYIRNFLCTGAPVDYG
jgi:translation initiation factor IF-2